MLYVSLFIAALLAFSISLICGGGAGLLLIPILGYSLPAAQVPAALSIGTSVSSVTKIVLFFHEIEWRIVKLFLPAAIAGVFFGAWLLSYLAPMYVELCMAVFLLSNLPYLFKKESTTAHAAHPPAYLLPFIGLLAGAISGLTGAVGVLFNRFYLRYGMSKEQIVATRAANEIILHIIKLILYACFGLFTLKVLMLGLIVALAAILSTTLMKRMLPAISIRLFSKIGYSAMVISGVVLFNSAIINIQRAHNPAIYIQHVAKGYDAEISWDDVFYTVEFKYNEGFEFEKIVPLASLPAEKQQWLAGQRAGAHKIVIEKVYAVGSISYEAYFYDASNVLRKKIEFN
ncbi:sulfite exporter TauE/SafE family protein [Methylophilus aquaticus]|uniref:Probable membrane transporter protein n=1 Tax=Methylophilus aquaticus TaxID=1971610 RepID=A0ABT9JUX5_9PROT|nr:sulfite exporter TauE/SafE family protein [Methylophilus aquaticus]MDP8568382.1 sulfite exporter TauE/SafE family protein [Methylophilus aquaticus]